MWTDVVSSTSRMEQPCPTSYTPEHESHRYVTFISIPSSWNSEISLDNASLFHRDSQRSMGHPSDGYNRALVPQDPNVETNHLVGNVSLTQAATTSHPIPASSDTISPVASSNEGSVTGVNGKRGLTCSICHKRFPRPSRAEACENKHQHKRPYACGSACGTSNW